MVLVCGMDSKHGIEHINHSKSLSLVTCLSESEKYLEPDPDVIDGRITHAYSRRLLELTDDEDDEDDHFEIQPRVSSFIESQEDIITYVEDGAESPRSKPDERNSIDDNVRTKHSATISEIVDGLDDKQSIKKSASSSSSSSDSSMEEFFQVDTNKVALLPPDPHTHKMKKYDDDLHGPASMSNVSRFSEVSKVPSLTTIQNPPIQVMSKVGEYDPNRIMSLLPPRRTTTSVDWSFASNDSTFSLHIGNSSFSKEDYNALSGHGGRSRELNKSREMIVFSPCPPISPMKTDERGTDPERKRLASTSHAPFTQKSILQSPPIQVMDRVGGYDPNRIPSFVFARTAGADWSVASNDSLFSIHFGNNSFSRDTFITICEEPLRSRELSKSRETIVYNATPPIPLMGADERSLESEIEVNQIQVAEDVNDNVIEATTDDLSFRKKATPGVTQCASSPLLLSNPSHHSDSSAKSSNSHASPIRTKTKKKKEKCAWSQFYCSDCFSLKCAGASCCCCSLGCVSCALPTCQRSNCGCSSCTWPSCCHLKCCSWPSCCCSNCDCATCAWTCQCCNCCWKKCSWPSCHCMDCSWGFCHTGWPNCLRWTSCYCAICSWVCCSVRNSREKKVNYSANTSMQAEASNSVEEDERQTLPFTASDECDTSRGWSHWFSC